MQSGFSKKYGRPVYFLTPGEFFAVDQPAILGTVLGSCVSACLIDEKNGIGGMNHFMLPGCLSVQEILTSEIGRYGLYAMELLIGEMIKKGADRQGFKARCFGGGSVLRFRQSDGNIPEANIRFIRKYFELEGIPLVAEDLGGVLGRKIYFFVPEGRVLLKRLKDINPEVITHESTYKSTLFRRRIS